MHLLVTGAAGFIGGHVAEQALRRGWQVTGLDNFDPFYDRGTKEANLRRLSDHPNFRFVEADIRSGDKLATVEGAFDAVVHLAAKAGVRPSLEDPAGYQTANVTGTQNVLELARSRDVKQFVFASSSSVYGVNPRVPWREDDSVLLPISPYASTKVSGELMGHVYAHLYGIRFLALRFFTVYGPRQRPDLAIHKFARLMTAGKPIPFYGDGSTRRDYTYVDDIVQGILAACEYDRSPYEVFNLGNDATVSLETMIRTLERALGTTAELHRLPEQPGDVPQTWADIAKARQLLGYSPKTSFDEGIDRFADWFRSTVG